MLASNNLYIVSIWSSIWMLTCKLYSTGLSLFRTDNCAKKRRAISLLKTIWVVVKLDKSVSFSTLKSTNISMQVRQDLNKENWSTFFLYSVLHNSNDPEQLNKQFWIFKNR
jgi:hypothetical protein